MLNEAMIEGIAEDAKADDFHMSAGLASQILGELGDSISGASRVVGRAIGLPPFDILTRHPSPAAKKRALSWGLLQISSARKVLDAVEKSYLQELDGAPDLGRMPTAADRGKDVYLIDRDELGNDTGRRECVGKLNMFNKGTAIVQLESCDGVIFIPYNLCDLEIMPGGSGESGESDDVHDI